MKKLLGLIFNEKIIESEVCEKNSQKLRFNK